MPLFDALSAKNTKVNTVVNQGSVLGSLLIYMLPLLLLVRLFVMFSRMQTGGRMELRLRQVAGQAAIKDMPKTTFADVAGVDKAVEELYEIKDFLQNPSRYQALGAKIPKGVLLYGPPGTGKTLGPRRRWGGRGSVLHDFGFGLRRDVRRRRRLQGARPVRAGQAEQPVHHLRRRDRRGRPPARRRPRRRPRRAEQTLNQLLVEMDGFGDRAGVILIAATNRPDILDPRCCGRAASTARSVSNPDMAGRRPCCRCIRRASPSRRMPTSTGWPSAPSACPAPTWPTSSTRQHC